MIFVRPKAQLWKIWDIWISFLLLWGDNRFSPQGFFLLLAIQKQRKTTREMILIIFSFFGVKNFHNRAGVLSLSRCLSCVLMISGLQDITLFTFVVFSPARQQWSPRHAWSIYYGCGLKIHLFIYTPSKGFFHHLFSYYYWLISLDKITSAKSIGNYQFILLFVHRYFCFEEIWESYWSVLSHKIINNIQGKRNGLVIR